MLDFDADLDLFFADFGSDLVFGAETAKGNVEHAEVETVTEENISVRARQLTVLVRANALPSVTIGKKVKIDGVDWVFRDRLKEDDSRIHRLIFVDVAP
jgi:hypothetical protein